MLSTDNQRQCSRCEEYIHPQSTSCPYCGIDLTTSKNANPTVAPQPNPLIINLSKPLNPLAIPASPYTPSANSLPIPAPEASFKENHAPHKLPEAPEEAPSNASARSFFMLLTPLLLLLSGSIFSLFGAILALYSEGGVFTLHWNSSYWPLYLGLAAPLLFFGWRALNKLEDTD